MNRIISARKKRKERKRRELKRQQERQQLQRLNNLFSNRKSKMDYMRKLENTSSFQEQFSEMKNILKGEKNPKMGFMKDYNVFSQNKDFLKTKKDGYEGFFDYSNNQEDKVL